MNKGDKEKDWKRFRCHLGIEPKTFLAMLMRFDTSKSINNFRNYITRITLIQMHCTATILGKKREIIPINSIQTHVLPLKRRMLLIVGIFWLEECLI